MVVVESIGTTSLLGHRPFCTSNSVKDVSCKQKPLSCCPFLSTEFMGRGVALYHSLRRSRVDRLGNSPIRALAMEIAKEVHAYRGDDRPQKDKRYLVDSGVDRKPGLWPPKNKADNPSLHNPLLRQERMGCGWFGAIFEWEGVIVDDNPDFEKQAWLMLAEEEGRSPPPTFILRRVEGMKNEQAISEVLCWSRDAAQLGRMASRKEEIYQALHGGMYRLRAGSHEFVNILMKYNIPMALVSTRPKKTLENAIGSIGIEECFSVIVTAEDVFRGIPDPEMFLYAAQLLQFIPERCIVFGNSNQTIEAAHDAKMKCVAVASKHPVYELGAADLIVRYLDELSVVDLKNLSDIESSELGSEEPELQMEEEDVSDGRSTTTAVDFW